MVNNGKNNIVQLFTNYVCHLHRSHTIHIIGICQYVSWVLL